MLREKEVENKDKKQNMFAALFVVIGFLSFSLWICDILLNKGQSRQLDLFSARMTDFLADFTNTSGYCAFRSPYDNIAYAGFWHKQYPPFAYIFFWVFSKFSWKMESYYATNNFLNMYQEPFFLVMLILVYVICCIIIFELVRKNMKGSEILRYGVAVTVILSFPMLFSIERGNNTLFASIFTMIYLFEYDSCSKCRREIALISLAVAAATKLFPAIFGILLLYQKRWKDALRTVLYGAALSVLPFFFFGGGFQYNYTLWIRNIRLAAEMHSPFEGCSIAAVIAGFVPASIATEKGRLFLLVVNYLSCILLLFSAPLYRHRWETILAVTIVVLSAQGQSWYYCLLYLIPFIIMFLSEEEFSLRCMCIWGAIVLMMTPYRLMSNTLCNSIYISIFIIWLIIEGSRQAVRYKLGRD